MRSFKLNLIFLFLIFGVSTNVFAQLKIGFVDSDAIMDNYPDAQDVQQRIDALVQEWQDEVRKMEQEWKTKFDDYEKRKLIMSAQTRAETEKELVDLERKIGDYRQQKFGVNGELFQKQEELMKPIQNKIFNVIQDIALEDDFDFIFDRSGDILFLFAKDEYDLTNRVLEQLK